MDLINLLYEAEPKMKRFVMHIAGLVFENRCNSWQYVIG